MKVLGIASGSRGNCYYASSGSTAVLIDAGISASRIASALKKHGEDIMNICAVLITHEHFDHIAGLAQLIKINPQLKIFAHSEVCRVIAKDNPFLENNLHPILSPVFYLGEFTINAFLLPHDSAACLGFSLYAGESKFSLAADLGMITPGLIDAIYDSNLIFIESNYSLALLAGCAKYPLRLKRRISDPRGHLSNADCAKLLADICARRKNEGLEECVFVLCHVSQNTNDPQSARSEVQQFLTEQKCICSFSFASQDEATDMFEI